MKSLTLSVSTIVVLFLFSIFFAFQFNSLIAWSYDAHFHSSVAFLHTTERYVQWVAIISFSCGCFIIGLWTSVTYLLWKRVRIVA